MRWKSLWQYQKLVTKIRGYHEQPHTVGLGNQGGTRGCHVLKGESVIHRHVKSVRCSLGETEAGSSTYDSCSMSSDVWSTLRSPSSCCSSCCADHSPSSNSSLASSTRDVAPSSSSLPSSRSASVTCGRPARYSQPRTASRTAISW